MSTPSNEHQVLASIDAIALPVREFDVDWRANVQRNMTDERVETLGSDDRIGAIHEMIYNAHLATLDAIAVHTRNVAVQIVHYIDQAANHLDSIAASKATLEDLKKLVDADDLILKHLQKQVQQIPLSQSSGGSSRQPKIGEPPEFNGSDGKVKFNEWLNKVKLWFVHEGVVTDRQRISVAMNKLSGAAAQYMEPWIKGLTDGTTIGTWDEFVTEMKVQYRQKDQKEGAKRELTKLFTNKDLAKKDFIKYAGNFRTLGRLSEYTDELLIDKLHNIIDKDMRVALIGVETHSKLPTTWNAYLDLLLTMHRKLNPEKLQAHIFTKEKEVPHDPHFHPTRLSTCEQTSVQLGL